MPEDAGHFSERHSLFDHSRPGRMAQTMKREAFNSTVFDSGNLTDFPKTSFHVRRHSKNRSVIRPLVVKRQERVSQLRRHRSLASGQPFGVGGNDPDLVTLKVNCRPFEFKNLTEAHSGCQSADDDRLEMFARAFTRSEQFCFFFVRQRSIASALVGHLNQRVVFLEGHTQQPAFLLSLSEHRSNVHQFPVDAGDGARATGFHSGTVLQLSSGNDLRLKSFFFIFLKFAMSNRPQFIGTQLCLDLLQKILFRTPGSLTFDDSAIAILRLNQITIFIPLREFVESFAGEGDRAFIVAQFIKFLLQILLGIGSILASSPYRMTLTVKPYIRGASVDVFDLSTLFDNYLQLTFAHVYTFVANWIGFFRIEVSEENRHGKAKGAYNQANRLFLVAEGYVGLLAVTFLLLIVDQEVVGSSPTSRPKIPNKIMIKPIIKWSALFVSTSKSPIGKREPITKC